jgi:hypothetical protein
MAHDVSQLPELTDKSTEEVAEAVVQFFATSNADASPGGAIEDATDDASVLISEADATQPVTKV